MPYHWVTIPSSPPQQRRDDVRRICQQNGGRLCENQIFYDQGGQAVALVQLPADEAKREALLAALGATEWLGLVDADEKAGGDRPPGSGQKS